ncbi:hypothetical protein GP486_001914 [Trichoglossum hirsutum]|uniref:cAMP-dependent protein kinase n=1 Tax=Trichoglossum hirsutum TaxID=265104 RepID=A0A9P8LFY1_9PEZI|nr:hypothetical protein GP486_001914 [Trichoglossum hirsutum]
MSPPILQQPYRDAPNGDGKVMPLTDVDDEGRGFNARCNSDASSPLPSLVTKVSTHESANRIRKRLERSDFEFVRTLGTDKATNSVHSQGTFSRVWLVQLATSNDYVLPCNESGEEPSEKVFFALKVLKKVDVIRLKQVEHVRNERAILASLAGQPFITNFITSFADRDSLYILVIFTPVRHMAKSN